MNRPCQPSNAEPIKSSWTITPLPIRSSNWVTSATSNGPSTPRMPFRVATEKRIPRLVEASSGEAHDWRVAYPGDPKIYTPNEVPGRNLPAAFLGDD